MAGGGVGGDPGTWVPGTYIYIICIPWTQIDPCFGWSLGLVLRGKQPLKNRGVNFADSRYKYIWVFPKIRGVSPKMDAL